MRELPMLLNGPMVRATMERRKVMTRRPIRISLPKGWYRWTKSRTQIPEGWRPWTPHEGYDGHAWFVPSDYVPDGTMRALGEPQGMALSVRNPLGVPGDLLYARETTQKWGDNHGQYRATLTPVIGDREHMCNGRAVWWYSRDVCPSIHMPKWAARLWVLNTGVGVEKGPYISEADARAEGFEGAKAFMEWWANQYPGMDWRFVTSYEVIEQLPDAVRNETTWPEGKR